MIFLKNKFEYISVILYEIARQINMFIFTQKPATGPQGNYPGMRPATGSL